LIRLANKYPRIPPVNELEYQFEVIGHDPVVHPINFQYKYPPVIPSNVMRRMYQFFLIKCNII